MDAVLLGLLAGALFGAMTVAVRVGLLRGGDPAFGGVVIASSAFVVSACFALPSLLSDGLELDSLLPFAAVGFFVPGLSQLLFILAVRYAGPSRAAILVGTAPLGSVLLAIALLDEPLRPVLRIARDDDVPPLQATAVTLLAATLATALYVVVTRRDVSRAIARTTARAFVPAGILLAFAYGALVTGFDRGDVGIVAPLNATQSLWGLAFAALVYGQREAIGRRTVLASLLIVLGGALIGAFR